MADNKKTIYIIIGIVILVIVIPILLLILLGFLGGMFYLANG